MSKAISSRTISSVVDKRLTLGNAQAARTMEIGTDWTDLLVGVRLMFPGTASMGASNLYIGVCSGVVNQVLSESTQNFAGVRCGTMGIWNYNAGPPAYYEQSGAYTFSRVGTTGTASFDIGSSDATADPDIRTCLFVRIVKTSPDYGIYISWPSTTAARGTDISLAKFKEGMETAWGGHNVWVAGYASGVGNALTVDEATNGYFDSVAVAWDRSEPAVEISDVAVTRYA